MTTQKLDRCLKQDFKVMAGPRLAGPLWDLLECLVDSADYLVGPPGSGAQYTSIQAAIDQAVADGRDTVANAATVYVKAGTYVEDVNMSRGVFLVGETSTNEGVTIVGNVTCNIIDTGSFLPFDNITGINGFNISPTTGVAMDFGGTARDALLIMRNCRLFSNDDHALRLRNISTWFFAGPRIAAFGNSVACPPFNPAPLVSVEEDSLLNWYDGGGIGHGNQNAIALQVIDRADGFYNNSSIFGQVVVSSANATFAGYSLSNVYIQAPGVPAVVCDSAIQIDGANLVSTAPNAIDGTGNVIVSSPISSLIGPGGVGVSGTVTMAQLWTGSTVPADRWAGSVPQYHQQALDRMVEQIYQNAGAVAIP